jgi:hypothetical protein
MESASRTLTAEAWHAAFRVIAGEAKHSIAQHKERMDCFAALAMTG